MLRWFSAFLVCAAALFAACVAFARSVNIPVTPQGVRADSYPVRFHVTATRIKGGNLRYEIVVERKPDSDPVRFARLPNAVIERVTKNGASFVGVRGVPVQIVNADKHRYVFTATPAEAGRLSFEVEFGLCTMRNGKRQWFPSAYFYYLALADFAPAPSSADSSLSRFAAPKRDE